nr:mitochondrial escape protein 2 [Polyrhizophydium stewartii]
MVSRVPTSRLHVEFHGPDLTVEQLYREFRNYGRIMDVTLQPSSSKDVPRFASVEFVNKRSATSARNCIHGESIDGTRVHIGYEKKSNSFSLWNWMMANLRISVPILLAIAAVISYLVFDPLRVFFITNKLTGRFSFVKYAETAEELLSGAQSSILSFIFGSGAVKPKRTLRSSLGWAEREKEEKRLEQHFKQSPETLVLVSGPKGSGKSDLVRKALEHHKNKLVIHCEDLVGQPEHILISRLASQVNFSPSFGFMSQITTFMDAIITATTGAKAGLSTTKENEIRKILDCVTKAVTDLTVKQRQARLKALDELSRRDADSLDVPEVEYPVIVIEDYLGKENSRGEFLYSMLTEWAAIITAQYRVAHVVFVSDNPAAVRELGKVIPTKSVEGYILKDATPESALAYVQRRLPRVTTEALKPALDSLGGRLHDLDLLIQKVNAGQTPADAFDDMVHRAITELRKIGMGEDMDSSKRQWTDVQFWKVAQMLSKFEEVPFDNLCIHPIFKGDPSPLIQMERDGLIILDHANGRPYSLRPGKPIYRTAFKQMNEDEKLVATMGIRTAKQLMADEEKRLKSYEDEMQTLASLNHSSSGAAWWGPGTNVRSRIDFLAEKLGESSRKVVAWSDEETKFKKMLKLAE